MNQPQRANHKRNIKFPKTPHVTRSISNKERGCLSTRWTLSVAHNLGVLGYVHSAVIAYGIVIIICHLVCVMEQKTFDGK
jgi:hypothetical protein